MDRRQIDCGGMPEILKLQWISCQPADVSHEHAIKTSGMTGAQALDQMRAIVISRRFQSW